MRATARAIAETVGKDIVEVERRCQKLEEQVAELRDRLDQEREKRLKVVPPYDKNAMIA